MEKGYHNIQPTNYTEHTILKDQNIYGAARIGSKIINKEIYSRDFNVSGGDFVTGQTTVSEHTHFENIDKTKRIVGYKHYEMANHLGNVLNVVTDRKVGNVGGTGYEADIVSYSDYYPYGMLLPGRVGSEDDSYRYGFQGQEMDDEIKGEGNSVNYKYRMHDPRIGRFFAVDPLAPKYPKWSPYQFGGNQVIHSVELEGLESSNDLDPRGSATSSYNPINGSSTYSMSYTLRPMSFEYSLQNEPADTYNFSQFEVGKPLTEGDIIKLGQGPIHRHSPHNTATKPCQHWHTPLKRYNSPKI